MLRSSFLLAATFAASQAFADLPAELSGTWYNLTQSGHGLSLAILPGERAVAIWHVYDPDGRPLTLYIDGRVAGRSILGTAYAPRGMRFGEFDPRSLQLPTWGSVRIDVTSCARARLQWDAGDPSYADGAMELTPLARPVGNRCSLPPASGLPVGLYQGDSIDELGRVPMRTEGLVDADGRLWAFERAERDSGLALAIPGPGYRSGNIPRVLRAEPVTASAQGISARAALYGAHALWSADTALTKGGTGGFGLQGSGSFQFSTGSILGPMTYRWQPGNAYGHRLIRDIDTATLSGHYQFALAGSSGGLWGLRIDADGQGCLYASLEVQYCAFAGDVKIADAANGVLDFELRDQANTARGAFRGRGWLQDTANGRELVLVGDNGSQGLLVLGLRR